MAYRIYRRDIDIFMLHINGKILGRRCLKVKKYWLFIRLHRIYNQSTIIIERIYGKILMSFQNSNLSHIRVFNQCLDLKHHISLGLML